MKKRALMLIAIPVVAGVWAFLWWQQANPSLTGRVASTIENVTTAGISEELDTQSENGPVSTHPVSISALTERTYTGANFTVGDVLERHSEYTRYAISYESDGLTITGIMNVPRGGGPFPVIVACHGYIDPAIYTTGRGLRREQDYFARQGFVVIHPDYRNHAGSDDDPDAETNLRFGYIVDVMNGIEALKKAQLPYTDISRIGLLGHSMGGGVVQGVVVSQPNLVQAAVLYAPVSGDLRENYQRWTERRPELAQRIQELYGSPESAPEFWANASPRTFYNRIATPIALYHGTADESVPFDWSIRLEDELKALGKTIEFHRYEGQPHEFTGASWNDFMATSRDFFQRSWNT